MDEYPVANYVEPVTHEFDCGGDVFMYDFSLTSVKQILAAETLFKLHAKLFSTLPVVPSELDIAVERNAKAMAFGALLMKKLPDGTPENYNPANHGGYEALGKIHGTDYLRLEDCRRDFFFNLKIALVESTMQSADIMRIMAGMDKESLGLILQSVASLSISKKKE